MNTSINTSKYKVNANFDADDNVILSNKPS